MIIHHRPRRGFSLIEMVAIMATFAVALAIGVLLLHAMMDLQKMAATHHHRIADHAALAERFRSDVHEARETLAHANGHVAGEQCLILKTADRIIIYQFEEGVLERIADDKSTVFALHSPQATVVFGQSLNAPALLTLTLTEPTKKRTPPPVVVQARLGGIAR
jgi:Tfp pilus assembly protein FimT